MIDLLHQFAAGIGWFFLMFGALAALVALFALSWGYIVTSSEARLRTGYLKGWREAIAHVGAEYARWFNDTAIYHLLADIGAGLSAEQVRKNWASRQDKSKNYFEVHVTTDPVPEELRAEYVRACDRHGFHIAPLLMEKPGEGLVSHDGDAFCTTRTEYYSNAEIRMVRLLVDLENLGIVIRRYKIEDTLLDSRIENKFGVKIRDPKAGQPPV